MCTRPSRHDTSVRCSLSLLQITLGEVDDTDFFEAQMPAVAALLFAMYVLGIAVMMLNFASWEQSSRSPLSEVVRPTSPRGPTLVKSVIWSIKRTSRPEVFLKQYRAPTRHWYNA